ncbi:MAG: ribosome-associated translation inhibitor RaiA [Alphaproteobacteria bacterium]|nr:ribosome-associated translation inhibitor RaiA [Alphaproteobacteria bacterium]
MDIRVSGHQVEVGEALRGHAAEAIRAADDKYHMRATSAQVTFGKGPHDHGFTCEIVAYAPPGLVLKALERAADARPAFEAALDKVAKQMRRNTRRQKDRNGAGGHDDAPGMGLEPAAERRGVG